MKRLGPVLLAFFVAVLAWLALHDEPPGQPPGGAPTAPAVSPEPARRTRTPRTPPAETAAAEPEQQPDGTPAPSWSIRASVRDHATDGPLAGARVVVTGDDAFRRESTTGADGVAQFDDLPDESLGVAAYAPGRVRDWAWPGRFEPGPPKEVELTLAAGLALTGVVLGPAGRPIEGVSVELEEGGSLGNSSSSSGGPLLGTTQTDAAGRFAFDGAPAGDIITVYATGTGFAPFSKSLMLAGEGEEPAPLEIRLVKAGTLVGTVRDVDQQPREGVDVLVAVADSELLLDYPDQRAVSSSASQREALRALTGPDGRYEIDGLKPGAPYLVQAYGRDRTWTSVRYEDVTTSETAPVTTLDITLRSPGRVVLRVVDEQGRPVEAHVRELAGAYQETTDSVPGDHDEPERYDLGNLAAGDRRVSVSARGFVTRTVSVEVIAGQTIEERVVLQRGLSIGGIVVDDRGEPLEGMTVVASRPSGPKYRDLERSAGGGKSGPDGRFEIGELLPGAFRVHAYGHRHEPSEVSPVTAGETDVRVVLQRRARVTLSVAVPKGAKAPEELSVFRRYANGGGSGSAWPADGKVRAFQVAPGKVKLILRADGYARSEFELELAPGEELDLGEVVLDFGVAVTGRIITPEGRPVPGAQVECGEIWTPEHQLVATDTDGRFRLEHLAAGRAFVTVRADGFRDIEDLARSVGAADGWSITLHRGALVRGTVRKQDGPGISEATVWFVDLADPGNDDEEFIYAEATGAYALRIRPGKYRVEYRPDDDGDAVSGGEIDVAEGDEVTIDVTVPK